MTNKRRLNDEVTVPKRCLEDENAASSQATDASAEDDETRVGKCRKICLPKRRRLSNQATVPNPIFERFEDSKMKIVSFDEYCFLRKSKTALESGVMMTKDEAMSNGVLSTNNYPVFFARSAFADKNIARCSVFVKNSERKFRKYFINLLIKFILQKYT